MIDCPSTSVVSLLQTGQSLVVWQSWRSAAVVVVAGHLRVCAYERGLLLGFCVFARVRDVTCRADLVCHSIGRESYHVCMESLLLLSSDAVACSALRNISALGYCMSLSPHTTAISNITSVTSASQTSKPCHTRTIVSRRDSHSIRYTYNVQIVHAGLAADR